MAYRPAPPDRGKQPPRIFIRAAVQTPPIEVAPANLEVVLEKDGRMEPLDMAERQLGALHKKQVTGRQCFTDPRRLNPRKSTTDGVSRK